MSTDDENLGVADRGALVIDRMMSPRRGTFTLIVPDSICFEVTESGQTIRLDFRPKTLRERMAMWRRRYGL
ncbi:hypothetical protein [Nannocystis pusilla]|uniref:hypothetical protein n=1 Tax=Nannocystis pusilla TaxID=889268 RepID=UPI003DA21350